MVELEADVLVVGAGGAGMYAAIAAAREGARVLLVDKSIVGRGGATIMAQMTVAAAIGHEEPDSWEEHFRDTVAAGRGLCNQELVRLLCQKGPERILEMDRWRVGWARTGERIRQVTAPGHSKKRCVYVDFLNTGPAVAATLQRQLKRLDNVRRLSNVAVVELLVDDGRAVGAVGLDVETGEWAAFRAASVVLAAGGLTKLFARNSASANMGGDAYALALRAGAELVDMEFVQFFPIAHLAPRLVGMDPIMWDPFRYKLGGRLLNGMFEEFLDRYGSADEGKYTATRDLATYAILKEVEAGRGSPHGGAYLDFRHVSQEALRQAFGPVIDRLLANGIDLTKTPVEVAPMAHYHMGGVRVDGRLESRIKGLFAAGEAVGGTSGANRLSGNAITEALVFGEHAGRLAALQAKEAIPVSSSRWAALAGQTVKELVRALPDPGEAGAGKGNGKSPAAVQAELQQLMQEQVGPIRTGTDLKDALARLQAMRREVLPRLTLAAGAVPFNVDVQDWFELRNMLLVAEAVAQAALAREESRGAHQREDFPETRNEWERNLVVALGPGGELLLRPEPVVTIGKEGATA